MTKDKLTNQLRQAGANTSEMAELEAVAGILHELTPPGLTAAARQRIDHRLPIDIEENKPKHRLVFWSLTGAGSFAVLLITVTALAQFALPGSPLYGLKRGLEEARVQVQPDYADRILENRQTEIKQLEQQKQLEPAALEQLNQDYQRSYERAERQHKETNPTWNAEEWRERWDWTKWYKQIKPVQPTVPAPTKTEVKPTENNAAQPTTENRINQPWPQLPSQNDERTDSWYRSEKEETKPTYLNSWWLDFRWGL